VQQWFAALDGKRFLSSNTTEDLPVLADMHIPTLARMLVLRLLVLDQLCPRAYARGVGVNPPL